MTFLRKLRRDEKGATAIEYGLIAALIAVAGLAGISVIGERLDGTFESVGEQLEAG